MISLTVNTHTSHSSTCTDTRNTGIQGKPHNNKRIGSNAVTGICRTDTIKTATQTKPSTRIPISRRGNVVSSSRKEPTNNTKVLKRIIIIFNNSNNNINNYYNNKNIIQI